MSLEAEMQALRGSVALSESGESGEAGGRACFRLSGPGAYAVADSLCPRELFLRDGQMMHTLLLDESARPLADLYFCADGEDYLLLAEPAPGMELGACLRDRIPAGAQVDLIDVTADHDLLALDGPYAWELLSEVISPEVIGLPYLGFFHGDGFTCFRAGNTGEFSFDLLLPKTDSAEWRERIREMGKGFDLAQAGREALDLCALENFFFNVRKDVTAETTPLELQLQWRVSSRKSFVGSEALAEKRKHWSKRVMLVAAGQALKGGDRLFAGNRSIGTLLHGAWSFDRKEWLGLALIELDSAYAGLRLDAAPEGKEIPVRVLSAPAINNRSLYVDPQRHSYATRKEGSFPSLILSLSP